ncbi:hypothetical protein PDN54_20060 [Bacillus cereus group sp. Bc252]|uniref:hypothetical protein n=1 Tax=Bacillus TaxID=1386 RepID=UPI000DCA3F05|nr:MULTISPECIES: hypothetical protein [Bacillus cereus group]RAT05610.1 hypothetical protein A6E22_15020 [Bacillus cereus]MCU5209265.1 hypothetical protein [Bacillus paranthracis]MDA2162547.1 hypothetical protein [Bacillus cereus group sp. Bc252]MDF9511730.1 hypothetical protein [Bacillus paranthracis]MDF9671315.1 hypothetical protein [Bacillus paranthracis]
MQKIMKQIKEKSIPMLIVGGMLLSNGAIASHQAFADTLNDSKINLSDYQDVSSKPMLDFLIKLSNSGALDELEYDNNEKIIGLKHDFATIQSMYHFTDEEIVYFKKFFKLLTTFD